MALFRKREKTAREKANKAQMGIFARLIGCGYLIYLMVNLINSPSDGSDGMSPTTKTVIAVVMLTISVVIVAFTLFEFVRNLKAGYYKESTYFSPEERAAYDATLEPEASGEDIETVEAVDVEYSEVEEPEPDGGTPDSVPADDNESENLPD